MALYFEVIFGAGYIAIDNNAAYVRLHSSSVLSIHVLKTFAESVIFTLGTFFLIWHSVFITHFCLKCKNKGLFILY